MSIPHVSPGYFRSKIETLYNLHFYNKYNLNIGFQYTQAYLSGLGNKNVVVWLRNIRRLIRHVPSPSKNAKFIDLGSGAGVAACYVAMNFDFLEIVGVEYDKKLVRISEENKSKLPINRSSNLTFIQKNVTDFHLDFTQSWIYLFNPFGEEIFDSFINQNLSTLSATKSFLLLANDHLHFNALRYCELIKRVDRLNLSIFAFK